MRKRMLRFVAALLSAVILLAALATGGFAAQFTDVPAGSWYEIPVSWAVAKDVTEGVTATTFCPNQKCTRAEAVTFLWRFDERPHSTRKAGFSDVKADAWYADAVDWSSCRGIVQGMSAKTFAPAGLCTRAQIVTILWRYAGSPTSRAANPFHDIDASDYFCGAVCWAVEKGITRGVSEAAFAPDSACTRAQIVTMLWRLSQILPEKKTVVLDPGHQLHANYEKEPIGPCSTVMKAKTSAGTYGYASKTHEYQLNLTVSLALRAELECRGYRVIMTRTTHDVDLSNIDRAVIGNQANADAVIRIHANGSTNASVSGAETVCITKNNPYCPGTYAKSRALSDAVLTEFCKATGAKKRSVWETDTMTGLNWSTVPVTILEMGYMSNQNEDLTMATASYQKKMVLGTANGIDAYFSS